MLVNLETVNRILVAIILTLICCLGPIGCVSMDTRGCVKGYTMKHTDLDCVFVLLPTYQAQDSKEIPNTITEPENMNLIVRTII